MALFLRVAVFLSPEETKLPNVMLTAIFWSIRHKIPLYYKDALNLIRWTEGQ